MMITTIEYKYFLLLTTIWQVELFFGAKTKGILAEGEKNPLEAPLKLLN